MGEKLVGTQEYEERIREFYTSKVTGGTAPRVGAGDWARLPSQDARRGSESEDGDAGSQSDSDSDSDDDANSDSDSEDENLSEHIAKLFQKSGTSTVQGKSRRKAGGTTVDLRSKETLRPTILKANRKTDLNKESRNKSITHCIDFHPAGGVALTAGLDRIVRVFQVDGKTNAKLKGVKLHDLQVATAKFTGDGSSIVLSGAQYHIYRLDVATGKYSRHRGFGGRNFKSKTATKQPNDKRNGFAMSRDGNLLAFLSDSGRINIAQNSTLQSMGTIHVPSDIVAAEFDPNDTSKLYTASHDSIVRLWDTRMMACVDQLRDEGAIHDTALAVSGNYVAVGSDSGIVNVYEKSTFCESEGDDNNNGSGIRTGVPKKTLENLTTPIHEMAFNDDGKLLTFSSRLMNDAVKIAHMPSLSVYANWPMRNPMLGKVQTGRFSPGGGWLALGNDKGKAHLYRLKAYPAN